MECFDEQLFQLHANVCKMLANPKRLMIIALVAEREMSVSEIAEAIGASLATTSQHLRVLRDQDVVLNRKNGQTVYYRLTDMRLMHACTMIRTVLLDGMRSSGKVADKLDPSGNIEY